MPLFSIVTPVLNMADFIGRCIESVQKQEVDFELIVIDGGSTDGTQLIVESFKDDRITLISEPDQGQSDAINKGLKMASGQLFNWLNADDEFTNGTLKKVASTFNENVEVVIGKCEHIQGGKTIAIGRTHVHSSKEYTLANYSMGQPSHFYRTDIIKQIEGLNLDLQLAMDMDLWIRYVLQFGTQNVRLLDDSLSRFHLHEDSKSVAQSDETDQAKFAMFASLLKGMNAPKWFIELIKTKASNEALDYNCENLNRELFLSEFAFNPMRLAYADGDLYLASKLFDLVKKGDQLSKKEHLEWQVRTTGTSAKLIKTLRGK
ncbi:MAG: glycosyltransferase involved in cell wall biosynthesis [Granulosicoccus sp.]|jgi:glycosyltransferase involved in cell wall biosynthesis